MKAIVQDRYGPTDVLHLEDIEEPIAGADEVLVRVLAASAFIGDWHIATGLPYAIRAVSGLRAPKNRVRGQDFAGRVEAVGERVTRFQPGDEVFGTCHGSFAEYATTREDKIATKPANLTFEQAATVPTTGTTALQGLRNVGKVQPGQQVLIIGAAGGVGSFAVQIAKAFGAHVTGVCSTTKVDLVRSIGADDVVDYTRDDFAEVGQTYDVILDTAGNRSVSHLRRGDVRDIRTARSDQLVHRTDSRGQRPHHIEREVRALMYKMNECLLVNLVQLAISSDDRGGAPGRTVDQRHFSEQSSGPDLFHDLPATPDIHLARAYDIHAVASLVLAENHISSGAGARDMSGTGQPRGIDNVLRH